MVDHSTQTPRDEGTNKHEELNVDGETTAGSADSVPDENKQGRVLSSWLRLSNVLVVSFKNFHVICLVSLQTVFCK